MATGKSTDRPASWHPGPHGHALRARILAYHYLDLLREALEKSIEHLKSDGFDKNSWNAKEKKIEVPAPVSCHPDLCTNPSYCSTTFEPRVGSNLLNLVKLPAVSSTPDTSVTSDKWHLQLYEADQDAVAHAKQKNLGYLDMKYVIQGNQAAGTLKLEVETLKEGQVFLCEPPGVFGRTPRNAGTLSKDTAVTIDGEKMEWVDDGYYKGHKVESATCRTFKKATPAGKHEIVLQVTDPGKYIPFGSLIHY